MCILRMKIDSDLKFEKHLSEVCNKANKRASVFLRPIKYACFEKKCILKHSSSVYFITNK